jgi:ribosomal protein L3
MPGRLGSESITLTRVEVIGVEKEQNLLVVKGPVPGKSGTIVMVLQTGKKKVIQAAKMKIDKKAGQAKTAGRSK